jgi:hypothetical protein
MLNKSNRAARANSTAIVMPRDPEIFIVDDEPIIGDLLNEVFSSEGY